MSEIDTSFKRLQVICRYCFSFNGYISDINSLERSWLPLLTAGSPRGTILVVYVCVCLANQSCLTLLNSRTSSPPGFSVRGILQARITEVGFHSLLQGDLPTQGIEPGSPALQAASLPSEPPGKPLVVNR